MNSQRVVIIVLVLIALLFLLSFGLGVQNGRTPTPAHPENYQADGFAKILGDLFSPFSPSVRLNQPRYVLTPVTPRISFSLQPDKTEFRKLEFSVSPDCSGISINYKAFPPIPEYTQKLASQSWPANNQADCRGKMMILKGGGTLTIGLNPGVSSPHTVTFK